MIDEGKLTSLDDYLTRMKESQDKIYFQISSDRESIESAPYLEAFKARGIEVLFLYEAIDEYLVGNLPSYEEKELVSIDRADLELEQIENDKKGLDDPSMLSLCEWMKETLGERVAEVKSSTRLINSPAAALITGGAMSPQMKQMMKQMNPDFSGSENVEIELNPYHELIQKLESSREDQPELSKMVAEQITDNALLSAGLLDKSKGMVDRVHGIMLKSLS
jgi:molecular chaperone HtpG